MMRLEDRPCVGCGKLCDRVLCEDCRANWDAATAEAAKVKQKPPTGLDSLSFCVFYNADISDNTVRKLLLAVKNDKIPEITELFASSLSRAITEKLRLISCDTTIVNVPRSLKNALLTGTDQAQELAVRLAKLLGARYVEALFYMGGNVAQKKLGADARKENAAHSYGFKPYEIPNIISKRCILVDDICTTGETLTACARLLRGFGAKSVDGATVAVSRSLYIRHRKDKKLW